jgi:hypothetical protein
MKPDETDFYNPSDKATEGDHDPDQSDDANSSPEPRSSRSVSWTASEYIEHHHGAGWYLVLLWGTAASAVLVYFVTKEYFAAGTIAAVGLIVGVFAARKPQQIKYELSSSGLRVGDKLYNYNLFKSFSILREGGFSSLNLQPLKRFMPPVTAHFEAKDQDKIVNAISDFLPYEEHKIDQIDKLSRKLRL